MRPSAITVTADHGGPTERILVSDLGSLEAGQPVIAGGVEVRWSRPASMLHPEPTELTLTIVKPRDYSWPDVGIDTRLTVTWSAGGQTTTVFDGHVDKITSLPPQRRRVRGRLVHEVTIEATCPIGRLGRVRIGEVPWPSSTSFSRAMKLQPYLPGFSPSGMPEITQIPNTDSRYTQARYLDVDSRSPIELAQQLVAGHRRVLYASTSPASPTVMHASIAARKLGSIKVAGGVASYVPAAGHVASVELPAWAVDDTERRQSFDAAISSVTVGYELGTQNHYSEHHRDVSKTWGDATAPGTHVKIDTMAVSMQYLAVPYTAEQFEALMPEPPQHADYWASLVTPNDRGITRLGPLRIPLSRLPDEYAPALHTLTDLTGRWGTAVHFAGITPDVSPLQIPIGGTLTLSGDPDECVLELQVEPFELSIPGPVEWRTFGLDAGAVELYQSEFTFHQSAYASEVI